MNDKKTKFIVGFFVACGLSIIVVTVIWLGMSNFFQKGDLYSIFFDESVQGLTVEAPVKYRGVPIGRVQRIKVAADSHLIEVVIELSHDFTLQHKVVAQLKVVGITGNMFIELDHDTDESSGQIITQLNFPTEYPVIPARSSDIKQLFSSVEEIVTKLKTIDIAGLATDVKKTINHIDKAITDTDITGLSTQIQLTFEQFNSTLSNSDLPQITARLNSLLEHLDKSVQALDITELSTEAKNTLHALRQDTNELLIATQPLLIKASDTIGAAENTIDIFNKQLLIISQQTQRTNSKLNDLIDQLNDQPSQLLFGDAPARRIQ
nr:MCE family protein [Desulfobulbaceae bacterium]